MILLIDNYDSFSYNLYQMLGSIDADIRVIRNDQMTLEEIDALNPSAIILSPGPGRPADAGIIEAAEEDNPGKTIRVDDKVAYVRIDTDGELILRRSTLERTLGRAFRMSEFKVNLGSFAGRIETTDEHSRFYCEKTL